jgi:hypothetical protein
MGTADRSFCLVYGRTASAAIALVLSLGLVACSTGLWTEGGPPIREVTADWADADAAVEVAAKKVEMGLERSEDVGPGRRYYLRTEGDEPVELDIHPAPGSESDPRPLRIEARVGRFGNAQREGQLAAAVARRLRQLAGVDYAPVR